MGEGIYNVCGRTMPTPKANMPRTYNTIDHAFTQTTLLSGKQSLHCVWVSVRVRVRLRLGLRLRLRRRVKVRVWVWVSIRIKARD